MTEVRTNERTYKRTNGQTERRKLYTPRHKCRGYKQDIKPPNYYGYGDRKSNILLCQLRNNKCQLNTDLHRDHLLDSPNCNNCMVPQTRNHFLFDCKKYKLQRVKLMNWLISQPNICETITINDLDLLQGNSHLSDIKNKRLWMLFLNIFMILSVLSELITCYCILDCT